MQRSNKKSGGWSLMELLIIIVIIGILGAISYIGYNSFQDNARESQIATATTSYQDAINAYSLEKDTPPSGLFCLPKNSKCCYSSSLAPTTVTCATDSEAGRSPGATLSTVSKYIKGSPPPTYPEVPTFTECTSGISTGGPCKQQNAMYVRNEPGAIYTSTESAKGFIIYYLLAKFDCNSKDTMTLVSGDLKYQSNLFTRRTSTYTECIVGVR